MMIVKLTEHAVDGPVLLAEMLERADNVGAVVSFCGVVRPVNRNGASIRMLRLDRHPTLTQISLEAVAADAMDRFELKDVNVTHRWGNVQPGETIVFVAAASPHRRAAFEAADYLMDRLKTDAVFWKSEMTDGAKHWIEPNDADLAAAARWSNQL